MKVKVCGLKDPDNIRQILCLKPDFIGLNFYPKSARYISQPLPEDLDFTATEKVGVFVNADIDQILQRIEGYGLDYIQLHGDEDLNFCQQLKKTSPDIRIVKVFRIDKNIPDFSVWESVSEYYLFDTKSKDFGGSGEKFDWNLLLSMDNSKKYMLAGGIGCDDITGIRELELKNGNFSVVDINSKFETSAGIKDTKLVEKFIREIRR